MSNINISNDSKTILLLCGVFGGKDGLNSVKPLTLREYNTLIRILVERELTPADLLEEDILSNLQSDLPVGIDINRIRQLLSRGASLAFALENWMNKGVWILTRGAEQYPKALSVRFGSGCPPILYGVGDLALLQKAGLAIVGSRHIDEEAETYTAEIGTRCVESGFAVVSGGARGVDQIAMTSALQAGGTAVGMLADSLLRASVSGRFRDALLDKRLLLMSPFNPDAGFSVGNAMARNRFIYALAKYSLIINAEFQKGGTWAGATEELKREKSTPVFVRTEGKIPTGNTELLKLGALPFPEQPWDARLFSDLEEQAKNGWKKEEQGDLFGE